MHPHGLDALHVRPDACMLAGAGSDIAVPTGCVSSDRALKPRDTI